MEQCLSLGYEFKNSLFIHIFFSYLIGIALFPFMAMIGYVISSIFPNLQEFFVSLTIVAVFFIPIPIFGLILLFLAFYYVIFTFLKGKADTLELLSSFIVGMLPYFSLYIVISSLTTILSHYFPQFAIMLNILPYLWLVLLAGKGVRFTKVLGKFSTQKSIFCLTLLILLFLAIDVLFWVL